MAIIENQKVEVKWHNYTKKHYLSKGYKFTQIGDTFVVDIKDLLTGGNSPVSAICDWCGETFSRPIGRLTRKGNKHHYCTNKCQTTHSAYIRNENRLTKKCEQCNNDYYIANYNKDTSRFCSSKCLNLWQSVAFKGLNSPKYVERISVQCDWCNKTLLRTPNQLKTRSYNFCDGECRQNWHREIFMVSEESVERNRNIMLSNLTNGNIKMTLTNPHIQVNELLNDIGLEYVNEKIINQYSLDIYLSQHDLYIEINGGFWHCDNRMYNKIEYDHQLNRIIGDKRKRTYLKNNLNKDILYLWEKEITENPILCKELIVLFIKNKGLLQNYHSFNYHLSENSVSLKDSMNIPYMELPYDQVAKLVDTTIREKVTTYNSNSHITFNCERCGKEKQQNVVNYTKAKNHYCSIQCKNIAQQTGSDLSNLGHIVNCPFCKNDFKVVNHRYEKWLTKETKNLFCSNDCKNKWKSGKKKGFKDTPIEVCCGYCHKKEQVTSSRAKEYRFCSKDCFYKSRRIHFNCDMCDKECQTSPSGFNKSKNHFCSNKCADSFRKIIKTVYNKCFVCDKWFPVQQSRHSQLNCSQKCQGHWQSLVLVGKNANNYKHGKFAGHVDSVY